MRFLVDVCTGGTLTKWLINRGFDVKEVKDLDESMLDEQIIYQAFLDNRIIITLDKDFGELFVLHGKQYCSIIRLPDVIPAKRIEMIEEVINKYSSQLKNNCIITVSEKKIRIRSSRQPKPDKPDTP